MKILNTIKILGLGAITATFLTGCLVSQGPDYSKYGFSENSEQNKIINSKEVIIKNSEDMKKYTEISDKVIRKICRDEIEFLYWNLGSLQKPIFDKETGEQVLGADGQPLFFNKQIAGRKDGVIQSFKIYKAGSGIEIVFSGKSKETREGEYSVLRGNTNGSMQTKKYNSKVELDAKYSLKIITREGAVGGLRQSVLSNCSFTDHNGNNVDYNCVNKEEYYIQDFYNTAKKISKKLETNYSIEMEKELSKSGLKFR